MRDSADSAAAGLVTAKGICRRKTVPSPGLELTLIIPSWLLMMPYAVDRPSPVPLPMGLVVKKGSKHFSTVSRSIPAPVSVTCTRACGGTLLASTRRRPPSGMASRALVQRFMITWLIPAASPMIGSTPGTSTSI